MQKVMKALSRAWHDGATEEELEAAMKDLGEDELADFIIWHFNRGKFTDSIKKNKQHLS